MTYFPCLASVTIICRVVVGQRSPATPPSILLAYDGPADDSGWKPLTVVSSVLLISGIKNSRFEAPCSIASPEKWEGDRVSGGRVLLSFEFQYLTPRNVACQTGSNLTNPLHHYTRKRTHNRTLNESKGLDCCICNGPISKCIYDEGDVIAF